MTSIQYTNTFADLLWFAASTYSRSPVILAFTTMLFGGFSFSSYTSVPVSATLGVRLLITAIMTLLTMLVFFIIAGVMVVLSFISNANKTILTQHTVTLADTGLVEETEFNRTEQKWAGITVSFGLAATSSLTVLSILRLSFHAAHSATPHHGVLSTKSFNPESIAVPNKSLHRTTITAAVRMSKLHFNPQPAGKHRSH